MKSLIRMIVLSTALLTPWHAFAAFTDQEAASLVRLHNARESLEEAVMHHIAQLWSAYTTPATRLALGRAMRDALAASRELNMAEALLVGVVTEQLETPPFIKLAASPRSERLRQAWWRIDRFTNFANAAREDLTAAAKLGTDPKYQDLIRRARDIWLLQAIAEAAAVNRALAYANPRPAHYPKIIGPHGDYDQTQWFLWRSQWYAHDALDNVVAAYSSEPLEGGTALGDVVMRVFGATKSIMQSLEIIAGLSWLPEQKRSSQFFRVLGVTKRLTDHGHVPLRWMEAIVSLRTNWFPVIAGRAVASSNIQDAVVRIADAWKHADMAAWETMEFPGCDPVQRPEGCGGTAKR
jgi:hypothetical protein